MADPELPLTGENVKAVILVNAQPFRETDTIKSLAVNEDAVMHKDQYFGRRRARPDKQKDSYSVKMEFDYTGSSLYRALQLQDEARENRTPIPVIAIALTFENRDGTDDTFVLTEVVGKMDKSFRGRTDRGQLSFDIIAADYKPAA